MPAHRPNLSFCTVTALLLLIASTDGTNKRIWMRTATLEPETSRSVPKAANAEEIISPKTQSATAQPSVSNNRWGTLQGMNLYLMTFESVKERQSLAVLLYLMEAIISSYLPENTWVVAADEITAAAAAQQLGISVTPYMPPNKVAPEWQPILGIFDPSGRTRRRLLQGWASGQITDSPADSLEVLWDSERDPQAVILVSFPFGLTRDWERAAHVTQAAIQDWEPMLRNMLGPSGRRCTPVLTPLTRSVRVAVCPKDLDATITWLSQQPLVHFVSPSPRASSSNVFAGMISQSGDALSGDPPNPADLVNTPFGRMGIDGTGQILGTGDTGIFLDSCFFFDPENPINESSAVADSKSGILVYRPLKHRKIVQYYGYQGLRDETGHGTHTSCTLAGAPLMPSNVSGLKNDPGDARGVAHGAKIAFFDILSNSSTGFLSAPPDLVHDYFQVQYDAGVRIQSDSWGFTKTFAYTDASSQVDEFTWKNPDFLSVFAAGNDAASKQDSRIPVDSFGLTMGGTIQSPANSKNALAVGSVMNIVPASAGGLTLIVTVFNKSTGNPIKSETASVSLSLDFGNPFALIDQQLKITVASPYLGCEKLTNPAGQVNGSLIIIGRGLCNFNNKVSYAFAAGAAAVLIINNETSKVVPAFNPDSLTIPVAAVPLDVGTTILALMNVVIPKTSSISNRTTLNLKAASEVQLTGLYQNSNSKTPFQNVPDFSGYGPLVDGRIKPDLVAPGSTILSAFNSGPTVGIMDKCSMKRNEGTSMSTPVVAGSASLVRQYFTSGYYPSGLKRSQDKYRSPSGMLLKAVMIAGADPVTGNSSLLERALEEIQPTGRFVGHGRLDLTQSLPLQGNVLSKTWNLQVVDMVPIAEGEVHTYNLTSTGGPLIATLVWYDFPADINANFALVNDLDLAIDVGIMMSKPVVSSQGVSMQQVLVNSNLRYLGNGPPGGGGAPDRINNVETIKLSNVAATSILTIMVSANSIQSTFLDPTTPQRYALVLLGSHQGMLTSQFNPGYHPRPPPPPSLQPRNTSQSIAAQENLRPHDNS